MTRKFDIQEAKSREPVITSKDKFKLLTQAEIRIVHELMSHHHLRDGVKHGDGSMGTIRITPKELRDCLAAALLYGTRNS